MNEELQKRVNALFGRYGEILWRVQRLNREAEAIRAELDKLEALASVSAPAPETEGE